MGAGRSAISSPDLARDDHRADRLLGTPVGGLQSGAIEKGEGGVSFPQQVMSQASILGRASWPVQSTVPARFQSSSCHLEAMLADLPLIAPVPQVERGFENGVHAAGKLRRPLAPQL